MDHLIVAEMDIHFPTAGAESFLKSFILYICCFLVYIPESVEMLSWQTGCYYLCLLLCTALFILVGLGKFY